MRRCSESGMTCGPFDGCIMLVVAEFEAVIVAERVVNVSSNGEEECAKPIVPGVPGVQNV